MAALVQNCNQKLFSPPVTNFAKNEKNKYANIEITPKAEESKSETKVNSDLARVLYNIKPEGANKKSNDSNMLECSDEISSTFKGFLDKFGGEISDTFGESLFEELKQV